LGGSCHVGAPRAPLGRGQWVKSLNAAGGLHAGVFVGPPGKHKGGEKRGSKRGKTLGGGQPHGKRPDTTVQRHRPNHTARYASRRAKTTLTTHAGGRQHTPTRCGDKKKSSVLHPWGATQ